MKSIPHLTSSSQNPPPLNISIRQPRCRLVQSRLVSLNKCEAAPCLDLALGFFPSRPSQSNQLQANPTKKPSGYVRSASLSSNAIIEVDAGGEYCYEYKVTQSII